MIETLKWAAVAIVGLEAVGLTIIVAVLVYAKVVTNRRIKSLQRVYEAAGRVLAAEEGVVIDDPSGRLDTALADLRTAYREA